MVVPCRLRAVSSSFSSVVPAGLVTIKDSETPFSVSWVFRAAEAAKREETPGTTYTSMPNSSRGFICSSMAP
jgi:hypothetical protein